tara:strand:+ start:7817 stop:10174 length:2358 start_codon:yes stop_codon:yes gene_type:complete
MSKNLNIDLGINGRIFQNWILKNFRKYKLPEIIRKDGDDPCDEKLTNELTLYQKFVGQYVNYTSPFKDLLIFHGVGSGKTVSAINIYNVLFNYSPKWNIFLLIPASLRDDPWLKDLKGWLLNKDRDSRFKNIEFVHYDSPFADKDFLEKVKKKDASKDTVYIFDESHKFMVNVYNNISSQSGKRAQTIYDYIQQEKKENKNTRIILMSATPVVNQPYEWALIFNLLRPGLFPTSEALFSQTYISSANYSSLNEETKNMFQRRILGLASYYIGATPDKFASKVVHYKNLVMSPYHEEIYNHFEEIEEQKEKMRIRMSRSKIGKDMSTFASYTRQACNFVFPSISSYVAGQLRPRPGKFRIKVDEEVIVNEGREQEKLNKLRKKKENTDYINAIQKYQDELKKYFQKLFDDDIKNKYTISEDIKEFRNNGSSFTKFWKESKRKSSLIKEMYNCGPKMLYIIFNIIKSSGPVLVYSNYVAMEGLSIFKIYLNFFGFINFNDDNEIKNINFTKKTNKPIRYKKDKRRFMEFHGGVDRKLRTENKKIYNLPANKNGHVIKIILISPAGAEGLSLMSTRQVHIMEPYWNEVKIEQVIGRAIRICSHRYLPMNERKVDVFRYKCIRKSGKITSDEKLEDISRRKNNLMLSFTEAVKEAAIDCELFKAHNMMGSKYKCFKFNQNSLFENPVGPSFNENPEFDIKINNGLNASDSLSKRIKVRKIKAIERIDEKHFSDEKEYWVDDITRIVYDIDMDYPIGKLELDESNNINKKNKETYIITDVIDVPKFNIFE